MQTLKDYVNSNLVDIHETLVISMEDSVQDVIKWLLTQESRETLIGLINAQSSNNTL